MDAKLVVVGGDTKLSEIKLRLPAIIGRGRGANIMLRHPLVSRQHCEIYEAEGQLRVRDMGSLNGTFVGNRGITDAPLPPGELLTVGTVTFRAVYGDAPDLSVPEEPEQSSSKPSPSDKTISNLGTMRADELAEGDEDLYSDFGPDDSTPLNVTGKKPGAKKPRETKDDSKAGDTDSAKQKETEIPKKPKSSKGPAAPAAPAPAEDDALGAFLRNMEKK